MSMYRQLWLALVLSTLLALTGSLLASTLSARGYLQEQLRMKNADNASALALSLSQRNVDAVEVELAVAALFDSGHYQLVRVVDPSGKTIAERIAQQEKRAAPAWFMSSLPLAAAPGVAQISNGWKQVGTITLVSHSDFAYRALWKSTLEMIVTLVGAGLLGGYLGTLILRRLRQPLRSVIEQANAISERRFVIMDEPEVPELRRLVAAMNSAVTRIKSMFAEEAARLEAVRRDANHDALTGLANRGHFMGRVRAVLGNEESPVSSLILVRVANLADINRRLGREATDDLIKRFAKVLDECAHRFPDGLAARLNGADFGLLLPAQGIPMPIAKELLQTLIGETSAFLNEEAVAYIGAGQFRFGAELGAVLSGVDTALAQAEAAGISGVAEAESFQDDDSPHTTEQWSQMIQQALDQQWVRLVSFPVANFSGGLAHRECPLRLMFSSDGDWLPAGRFLPVAERIGLTPALDLSAIKLGLEELSKDPALPGLAINLSARSIQDENFRKQVRALLVSQAKTSQRLWLEVNEHGALAHFDAFVRFCKELAGTGCKLGMEHFGRQFSEIGRLHDLGLDYLKVDASFIRGIEGNAGNQAFLKGLTNIAHNIGLKVFAEGVVSAAELAALGSLGFDGATGPAVKEPA
jgi:EAL domain-containing protein (putative c-di-GMP-specific phosphodiesterase class I)/GGDEF domain-containing protein